MVKIAALDVGGIVDGVMSGLDGLFTSDEEKQQAKLALTQELQKPHVLQAATNIQEAKHKHWFVAGWRPGLGWVCVIGLMYSLVLKDLAIFIAAMFGADFSELPDDNLDQIISLTISLLGLGTMRTIEKLQGVDTSKVTR